MSDRDKFLTEAMGMTWHSEVSRKIVHTSAIITCSCGKTYGLPEQPHDFCTFTHGNIPFSSWKGFGLLWTWAIEQDWMPQFKRCLMKKAECLGERQIYIFVPQKFIHPSQFADELYEYLKQREN